MSQLETIYSNQNLLLQALLMKCFPQFMNVFADSEDITELKLKMFLDEACFLTGFKHPNILNTLGVVWKEGDRPKVILPYMELGDLCSLVRRTDMVCKP